jgi:hypothetical protein
LDSYRSLSCKRPRFSHSRHFLKAVSRLVVAKAILVGNEEAIPSGRRCGRVVLATAFLLWVECSREEKIMVTLSRLLEQCRVHGDPSMAPW